MASTTPVSRLIAIRDKHLDAIDKLAGEGVSSYSIGDQSFTLADVDKLMNLVQKLDRIISVKRGTMAGTNRADFRNLNA